MRKLILLLMLQVGIVSLAINSVSQNFSRQDLSIETTDINGSQETLISYDGVDYFGSIGEPSVPVKTLRISVPYNAVNIKLSYSMTKECEIGLSSPVHLNVNEFGDSTEYFKGSKFPLENAMIDNIGYVDGINKIITICLCPVSLNLDSNVLTFYSNVSASLTWDTCTDFTNETVKPIVSYATDKKEQVYRLPGLVNPDDVEKNKPVYPKKTRSGSIEQARYIIVCPKEFCNDLERLAAYRRLKGYTTKVFAIEDILADPKYAEGDVISGINDDAGKLRAFLTDAYTNRSTSYVLLAGKYPAMPIRYGHTNDTTISQYNRIPTDLYFSELNSSWNTTNSGHYGMREDKLDYHSEIYVGRIPFTSNSEINDFIDKLKIYEHNPGLGDSDYLSRAFVTCQMNGLIGSETYLRRWLSYMETIYKGNNLRKIISNENYPTGQDVITELNSTNYGCLSFIGHGTPYGVAVNQIGSDVYDVLGLENQYEFSKYEPKNGLNNLTNKNYPSWSYSMSCATMPFDTLYSNNCELKVTKNFGESYVLGKDYGGVLYFGHTRPVYIYCTQILHDAVFSIIKTMHQEHIGEDGPEFPVTAGMVMAKLRVTSGAIHEARLSHNLLGDPVTPLWVSKLDNAIYIKDDSEDYLFRVNYDGEQQQCLIIDQLIGNKFHTGTGLAGKGVETKCRINLLQSLEFPNSRPIIFPLYLQNIKFSKDAYIVAGDVYCGWRVNESEPIGAVELSDSVSLTIESLGNVSIQSGGTGMKPYSELIIKADGDVNIATLAMMANTTLVVEANTITIGNLVKPESAIVKLKERNPQNKVVVRNISKKHKPMLVEGRTWWYTSKHRAYGHPSRRWIAENGISVGEEVEIDGIKWHRIDIISTGISRSDVWEHNTTPRTIAYMREDGNKIFTAYFDGVYNGYVEGVSEYMHEFTCYDYPAQLSYEYKNIGESYIVGDENDAHVTVTINDIYQCTNSGYEYTLYECDVQYGSDVSFIDGLGCIANHYFFDPVCGGTPSSITYDYPQLRYITDPDGSIIYEGIGGYKLWEATGVDNVIADSGESYRWYNLQGMAIDEPTTPGIYIRCSRGGNEKVIIR